MLIFLWVYVMTAAMTPGGRQMATSHADAVEAHMRAQIETVAPRAARTLKAGGVSLAR
ncbi:MAG: hypothetical protein AB7L65_06310 [Hyphomonadaceae bacterium]